MDLVERGSLWSRHDILGNRRSSQTQIPNCCHKPVDVVMSVVQSQRGTNRTDQTPPPGGEVVATVFFNNDPAVLPTGVVTLTRNDTGATLATGTISKNGTAVIPFFAPEGTYSVLASWKGDANYLPGYLSSYEQIITTSSGTSATRTTLSASTSTAAMGQETQFTVHVGATGKTTKLLTGTVTLYSAEGQLAGSMTVVGGQATGFVQWGHVAVEKVYAVYSGDSNFAASSSSSFTVTVTRAVPTLALKANASKVVSGTESSLTAILSSGLSSTNVLAPTGTIQFYDSVNGAADKAIGRPQAFCQRGIPVRRVGIRADHTGVL